MAKARATKSEDGLQIGIASIDITPPLGVTLTGYGARTADGVGHRLRADALACKGTGGEWLLITSDMIGYDTDTTEAIRKEIGKATGLKPGSIMLSGTHTHSGPVAIRFRLTDLPAVDLEHFEDLKGRLVKLAAAAWKARRPGSFEVAWSEAPLLGSNRRIRRNDGTVINQWEDDFGTHPGYFDPTIMLMGVRRPGEAGREAILVNYGVHPVVLGPSSRKISADYVGYMRDALEAKGDAKTVMFALSGAGNINPRTCIRVGAEFPRKMGESLAGIVSQAVEKLSPVAGDRVEAHQEPWEFARSRDALKGPQKKGDKARTEIQIFRAGDLVLLAIPGELLSEFNRAFREASPFPHTAIVSLANGYYGYLCTDAVMAEGAYEATMAPTDGVEAMLHEHVRNAFAAVMD
jgi:hypothetical protein